MYEIELKPLQFEAEKFEESGEKSRRFSGVAYTGDVIPSHGWLKNLIIDLEGVDFKDQIPIFKNHDSSKVIGFGNLKSDGTKLTVDGKIVVNEHSEDIFALADEGFRWELSVGMSADELIETGDEEELTINGRLIKGRHSVFKNPRITETSFVPIGADKNTHVSIFSKLFQKDKVITLKNKITETMEGEEMNETKIQELELKLEAALKRVQELELSKETKEIQERLENVKFSSDELKELVFSSLIEKKTEREVELSEALIKVFSQEQLEEKPEEVEEQEAGEAAEEALEEVKAEEQEKAEEEKKEEIKEELKKELQESLPTELFQEKTGLQEPVELEYNEENLIKKAKELQEKEKGLSFVKAIFKAKALFKN